MTPLLIQGFGVHPLTAVGTDLLYAATTKSVGTAVHAWNGNVDWRVAGLLAVGSVPATVLTIGLLSRLPPQSATSPGRSSGPCFSARCRISRGNRVKPEPSSRRYTARNAPSSSARSSSRCSKQMAAVVEQERKALAARAQRSAIVSALKVLGYEAREGMQTAVAQDGTMIVRRAANAEMGVQVSGMHGGGRVQLRPVRFGSSSSAGDTHKDRDIEMIWCSDFERLKEKFHAEA